MVSKLRNELTTVVSSPKRIGRDGKCRKMPVPKKRPAKETGVRAAAQADAATRATADAKPKDEELGESRPCQALEESPAGSASADDNFDAAQAWEPVEQYLLREVANWPKTWHRTFGQRLQQFADAHCE